MKQFPLAASEYERTIEGVKTRYTTFRDCHIADGDIVLLVCRSRYEPLPVQVYNVQSCTLAEITPEMAREDGLVGLDSGRFAIENSFYTVNDVYQNRYLRSTNDPVKAFYAKFSKARNNAVDTSATVLTFNFKLLKT